MLRVDELAKITEEHYRQIRTQGELRDNDTITDKQLNVSQTPVINAANAVVKLRLKREEYRAAWEYKDTRRADKWEHKDKVREMKTARKKLTAARKAEKKANSAAEKVRRKAESKAKKVAKKEKSKAAKVAKADAKKAKKAVKKTAEIRKKQVKKLCSKSGNVTQKVTRASE